MAKTETCCDLDNAVHYLGSRHLGLSGYIIPQRYSTLEVYPMLLCLAGMIKKSRTLVVGGEDIDDYTIANSFRKNESKLYRESYPSLNAFAFFILFSSKDNGVMALGYGQHEKEYKLVRVDKKKSSFHVEFTLKIHDVLSSEVMASMLSHVLYKHYRNMYTPCL